MSGCCPSPGENEPVNIQSSARYRCPVNHREYAAVSQAAILHHIDAPWKRVLKPQAYFFCDDPECDVVYFGEDDSVIRTSALRTVVGIKQKSDDALLCYCFGISVREAATDPAARAFVIEQTRAHVCACETRNPSGRCCLKDFSEY